MPTPAWLTIEVDASLHDPTTLEWGMAEAELRQLPVLLVQVVAGRDHPVQGEWYPSPHHRRHTEAIAYLQAVAEREGSRRPGTRVATRLLAEPRARALSALSRESEMLVVGPHAGGGPGVGPPSGGAQVVAHAHCPVAVVSGRPAGRVTTAPVVAGVDGSPESAAAAVVAAREAALRGTTLVLVHARAFGAVHRELRPRHRHAAHAAAPPDPLDEIVSRIRAAHPGLPLTVDVVRDTPADALVDRSRSAALTVVGTRGRGPVRVGLLGSVSTEVVRRADGTIVVVHDIPPGD